MSIVVNPLAVGWKKNHAPGIRCKANGSGDMILVKWPEALGVMPTQAVVDQWDAEYQARDTQEEVYNRIDGQELLKAVALVCADQFGMTPAQFKAAVKAKL